MSARTILMLAFALTAWTGAASAVEQGDAAPAWTAEDFAGRQVQFPSVSAGKPAVVLFWATWCPYCKAFMPYLKRIQADYAAAGVTIIAINTKERGRGDPEAYVASLGFPLVGIPDGDRISEAYGVQYVPGLFVVDGKGAIAYRRPWTDLPAGSTVAELWDRQVRAALDSVVARLAARRGSIDL
jgi:thiol-disulfide isomerase/thioredoxin